MLRSDICALYTIPDPEKFDLNECPDDPGGYFVINGQEKVLIAQERMAGNHVYVFAKGQPSPISFLAEIRSVPERGGKLLSSFQVKLFHKGQEKSVRMGLTFTFHMSHSSSERRSDPSKRSLHQD